MSTSEDLATRLLGATLPSPEVTETLLARADLTRVITLVTPPRPQAASRLSQGKITATISFAASVKDPHYLKKASRDSRITVRRAVAGNPATPPEVSKYLLEYAIKHDDALLASAVVQTLAMECLLENFAELRKMSPEVTKATATRVAHSATVEDLTPWAAVLHAHEDLASLVGGDFVELSQSHDTALSITQFISCIRDVSPSAARHVLAAFVARSKTVDREVATLMRDLPAELSGYAHADRSTLLYLMEGKSPSEHLVRFAIMATHSAGLLSGTPDPVVLSRALDVVDARAANALTYIPTSGLTTDIAVRLGTTMQQFNVKPSLHRFFSKKDAPHPCPPLPSAMVVWVLCHAEYMNISSWLSGSFQQPATPYELGALLRKAIKEDLSLFERQRRVSWHTGGTTPRSVFEALVEMRGTISEFLPEIVDATGMTIVHFLTNDTVAYIAQRMTAVLGDTPAAWAIFLSMVESVGEDESFEKVLATAATIVRSQDRALTPEMKKTLAPAPKSVGPASQETLF